MAILIGLLWVFSLAIRENCISILKLNKTLMKIAAFNTSAVAILVSKLLKFVKLQISRDVTNYQFI
ncbi:hypothetical protein CAPN009_20170 [Capnocytophaga canimorsus]|nr:hypothetical protein CAPN009_20170 [Capnocytophaga canimorsus]